MRNSILINIYLPSPCVLQESTSENDHYKVLQHWESKTHKESCLVQIQNSKIGYLLSLTGYTNN